MNSKRSQNYQALLLVGALIMPCSASADKAKAAEYYESAAALVSQGKPASAIIELKNALQQNADLLPAHVLLGKVYLSEGSAAQAEEAFLKAKLLGADKTLVYSLLAQSYLLQSKFQTLVGTLDHKGLPRKDKAELFVHRGHAYLQLRDFEKSNDAFLQAANLSPQAADPIAGRALLLMHQGQTNDAKKLADQALLLEPENAEGWNVQASLAHRAGNLVAAQNAYGKVLGFDPKHLAARLARVGIYLDLQKIKLAEKDLAFLRTSFPYEPRSLYLQSVLFNQQGKQSDALKNIQTAADVLDELNPKVVSSNQTLMMLASLVYFDLNRLEKAEEYLKIYIARFPSELGARKLLANILLKSGRYQDCIKILSPVVKQDQNSPDILSLLGRAYIGLGQHDQALSMLTKAVELDGNVGNKTELALSQIGVGNKGLAIELL
ncbi:MAG: tetratricopeptide repeat protein [Methylococcales bacterium]|nr:tetratricopeptide repeat protein [Methylococcales bacterium]